MKISLATQRTLWTEQKILDGIMEVVNGLGLDRAPSFKEIREYYHSSSLTCAISKRKGIYEYAKMLNLEVKRSETGLGKAAELDVVNKLIEKGHATIRMPQNFPYDILVDNAVKVDSKVSHLYHGKNGNFYTFNLEKPFCTCDIYVLTAIGENGDSTYYVVPSCRVPSNTQISIGEHTSIYHQYQDRWDYIARYSDFMRGVA